MGWTSAWIFLLALAGASPAPTGQATERELGYDVRLTMSLGGNDVAITARMSPKRAEDGRQVKTAWSKLEVLVSGSPYPFPDSASAALILGPEGELRAVKGGILGIDMPRFALAWHFPIPADPSAEAPWTLEVPRGEGEGSTPPYQIRRKLLGSEEVDGRAMRVYELAVTESPGGGQFSSEAKVWVDAEGVFKVEARLKNLPIPIVGDSTEATLVITRKA